MKFSWFLIILAVSGLTGYYWGLGTSDRSQAAFVQYNTESFAPKLPTKTEQCAMIGSLPDSECTQGSIFPNATVDKICVSGYTKTVRSVPVSLKKKIYRMYGIKYPQPFGTYEADHFIPLALGGDNDVANLFPEPAEPRPGFKEKDLVESYLYEKVCSGEIELPAAQRAISGNWLQVYDSLSDSEISRLKNKYKDWTKRGD